MQLANTDNLGCILLKDREINAHNFRSGNMFFFN